MIHKLLKLYKDLTPQEQGELARETIFVRGEYAQIRFPAVIQFLKKLDSHEKMFSRLRKRVEYLESKEKQLIEQCYQHLKNLKNGK